MQAGENGFIQIKTDFYRQEEILTNRNKCAQMRLNKCDRMVINQWKNNYP